MLSVAAGIAPFIIGFSKMISPLSIFIVSQTRNTPEDRSKKHASGTLSRMEIVSIALSEPENLLKQQFTELFALKLVSNFECANFQNFRTWVARSRPARRFHPCELQDLQFLSISSNQQSGAAFCISRTIDQILDSLLEGWKKCCGPA